VNGAVRVPRSLSLETSVVSLSAWVKLEGTQAQWATIVKKTYADDTAPVWGSYSLSVSPSGDANFLGFFTGGSSANDTLESQAPLPLNQWVHVAGTYDPSAGQKRLYVGGQLVASRSVSTPLIYDTSVHGDLYFGRDPGPDEAFKGLIDNIGIWGRALTAAEVTALASGAQFRPKYTVGQGDGLDHPPPIVFSPGAQN